MKDKDIEVVKNAMRKKTRTPKTAVESELLSTGSTLLNLNLMGKSHGGFKKGIYILLVGDSASGKTFMVLTALAEASINPSFDNYDFIYDGPEFGAMMDLKQFFGRAVADRLCPPNGTRNDPRYSENLEEFYYNVDEVLKRGPPCIYILDSIDALLSSVEEEKFQEDKKAHEKGKGPSGSYGTSKPKVNSNYLRRLLTPLHKTGSILMIICQTRDNIGFGSQFNPKVRAGGHALRFYAHLELWTSIRERLKKKVKGKDRQIGILAKIQIKKNRLTGRERSMTVPIYYTMGMDDVGSCVQYLIDERHWKAKGRSGDDDEGKSKNVSAPEFGYEGPTDKLIKKIEDGGLEKELRDIVVQVFHEIETECTVERKKRYV